MLNQNIEVTELKMLIRQAVADYMSSGGCSCCQNTDAHKKHAERLAKLLGVKKYSDGSGYDFSKYKTTKP